MTARLAPCLLLFAFAPADAAVCESARLDLPEPVADAVRSYVACGMFSSGQDYMNKVTGGPSPTSIPAHQGLAACATVRKNAALEAGRELLTAMPDRPAREAYIEAVLQDADRFVATSQDSHSVGIDPVKKLASCGMDDTRTASVEEGQP